MKEIKLINNLIQQHKKAIKLSIILLLFIPLLITGINRLRNKRQKVTTLKLENFSHLNNDGLIQIDVTDGKYYVVLLTYQTQPTEIEEEITQNLNRNKSNYLKTDDKGIAKVQLKEEVYNQPNIILFLDNRRYLLGYIELLRQSGKNLKQYYNFEKKDGYTILGRTDLVIPNSKGIIYSNLPFIIPTKKPYPESIKDFYPKGQFDAEIIEAIGVMRYLWSEPINIGPTNSIINNEYGILQRLEMLRSGEWSTQCSDFRTIFNNLALHSKIIKKIRRVELRQYYPSFKDLITNSHSISEIYVEKLHKWIAVDPWFGYLFSKDNVYLSVKEMTGLNKADYSQVKIEKWVSDRKISTQLPEDNNNFIIITNGYFGYFGSIEYGPTRYK